MGLKLNLKLTIKSENLLISYCPYFFKVFTLLIISTLLNTIALYGQEIIIKPDENLAPFYTLEEWIYKNSNWNFDSYDFNTIEVFSTNYSGDLENGPAVFIDGKRFLMSWLTNESFNFPEISINQIDSVVVNPYKKISNGIYTSNGSINIYLKQIPTGLIFDAIYVNQIYDPGLNLGSDLSSPNVEYVRKTKKVVFNLPELLSSTFFYSGDDFSRTGALDYNENTTRQLGSRTRIRDNFGEQVFQRNRNHLFFLKNSIGNSLFDLSHNTSYILKNQYYTWHPISGIEVPSKHHTFQTGLNFKRIDSDFYKSTQVNYSYSTADSLEFQDIDKPKYNLIEQQVHHTSTFGFKNKEDRVNIYLNNLFYNWEDIFTGNSKTLLNSSLSLNYVSNSYGIVDLMIGNYTIGFEYQKDLWDNYSINASTFRSNLEGSGYNYTFWNEGIGFSNLDPSIHSVTNSSSFTNIYSTLKLSSTMSKQDYQFSWNIYPSHYWQFVNTTIDYNIIPNSLELGSDISYNDEQNVGFIGFYSSLQISRIPKTSLRTTVSGRLHTYGSSKYLDNAKGINNFLFSQSVLFKAHENAFYELSFRYISPREIHEFESLEEVSNLYQSRVRPIKMLNASIKTWFIDRSLLITLSLRNLLNSTESYNTNGQYYNMSIHFSGVLHIGKK